MEAALAGIARALAGEDGAPPALSQITASASHGVVAESLQKANHAAVILGPTANAHPSAGRLRTLAAHVAGESGAALGTLVHGANGAGAWLAGALPHRGPGAQPAPAVGLDAGAMLEQGLAGYLILGLEPELDCADSARAMASLQAAECVVCLTAYAGEHMKDYADVLLPIAPYVETSGTYVNLEGNWQSTAAVVKPAGESRPAWRILRVLGNLFEVDGFDYQDSSQVLAEVHELAAGAGVPSPGPSSLEAPATLAEGILRVGTVPIYAGDPVVRRAGALQRTADGTFGGLRMNSRLASTLGLGDGQSAVVAQNGTRLDTRVVVDEGIADDCAALATGVAETVGLGPCFGTMSIEEA
jgi:NADH-quinone oxidoreductase subunit G